jgi:hypothetical protein
MRHPRRVRASVVAVALALGLASVAAYAQESCDPASTSCQHCPPPAPCAPANDCPWSSLGPPATYGVSAQMSCPGGFSQVTRTITLYDGPAELCVGANRSVGCHVPKGAHVYLDFTETITASTAAAIPTLSPWSLGALAAGLGAMALRRLTLRSPGA